MRVLPTALPEVVIIEPRVFEDARGFFVETWNADRYREHGLGGEFYQDNLSSSGHGTVRGLHFQHPHAQGKLIQVLDGEVFDVAVDVRRGSPTFGRSATCVLSGETLRQLWVPPGFAHGFCVTSAKALFSYKCTAPYRPDAERSLLWSDPDLNIDWPVAAPLLSSKDAAAPRLRDVPPDSLPSYRGGAT